MSENKKIEIIPDNGKRIQISKVYDHIEMEKPKEKKQIWYEEDEDSYNLD